MLSGISKIYGGPNGLLDTTGQCLIRVKTRMPSPRGAAPAYSQNNPCEISSWCTPRSGVARDLTRTTPRRIDEGPPTY